MKNSPQARVVCFCRTKDKRKQSEDKGNRVKTRKQSEDKGNRVKTKETE